VALPSAPDDEHERRRRFADQFEAVVRHLHRSRRDIPDATAAELRPNQWIRFDADFGYGPAHEDSGLRPDDVALFAADTPTRLLLCGSVEHLRGGLRSVGRMGSSTGWLHELIVVLHEREQRGVHVIPELPASLLERHTCSHSDLEQAAIWVHGVVLNNHPPAQRGRLVGLARVLLTVDEHGRRLVVATPLYVEIPPPVPRKRSFISLPAWSRTRSSAR
jgi:hypothetical protein